MNDILLIGITDCKHKIEEIVKYDTVAEVEKYYGQDSILAEGYRTLKNFDIEDIYLLNLSSWDDIKDNFNMLQDNWFSYIVPLGLKLTDSYVDILSNSAKFYYSQLLTWMSYNTPTTIIITGEHASGYENLSAFVEHENKEVETIKPKLYNLQKDNIIYVANCLKKYKYANAVLAAMLMDDIGEYPEDSRLGQAYFDIYYSDFQNEVVFFKNNYLRDTTVENLVNFSESAINKPVIVNRILKYIFANQPDFTDIIGTGYSAYKEVKVSERVTAFLTSFMEWIIYGFKINSITSVRNDDATVSIHVHYDIWPKFTNEKYEMDMVL